MYPSWIYRSSLAVSEVFSAVFRVLIYESSDIVREPWLIASAFCLMEPIIELPSLIVVCPMEGLFRVFDIESMLLFPERNRPLEFSPLLMIPESELF